MELIIDIGNSNIVIAIKKETEWLHFFRYETKDNQPQMFYQRGLSNLFLEWGIRIQEIDQCIISSVVPELNLRIMAAVENVCNASITLINPESLRKLPMHIPHINEIGSDLVANAFAAISLYKKSAIVVDFGTALTFTVVHIERGIIGVTIAPGIITAFASLTNNTAQLPLATLTRPDSAIGKNTSHAIQAGVIIGYEGLVNHLIQKIKGEIDFDVLVIGTGGISEELTNITTHFDIVNKKLTLEGVALMAQYLE